MSILTVRDIQGLVAYNNTVRIPTGHNFEISDSLTIGKNLTVPVWTTATRPSSPIVGVVGFNNSTDVKSLEFWNGNAWVTAGSSYPQPITSGLVLYLDANKAGGYVGTTWTDHANVIGNVNIQNRTTDWSFQIEPSTGLVCAYNITNRTTNAGINIPVNTGFNKITGTIELWIRPGGDYTGGHGFFNNSDGISYTNASNWFWFGTWDTSNCIYFRQGNGSTCCNDVSSCSFKSSGYYPLDQWQQFAITWNVSSSFARIYRNGNIIYSSAPPTDIPNSNPTNTGQLFNGHTRSDNMQFKGYCSQYRIYNRALSDQEVLTNYNTFRSLHKL